MTDSIAKLLTPDQLIEKYPGSFTKSWIMSLIRERNKNGVNVAVFKVGKKLFIDEEKFFTWIESHGEGKPDA